jgi:peptide/nickel transport system substrate-binding protein
MGTTTRKTARIGYWLTATLVALALIASACGGGSSGNTDNESAEEEQADQGRELVDEQEPQEGGKLIIAVPGETNGWSPQYSQLADAGQMVAGSFYEGLARYNADGEVEPFLLESYTPNEDFTEWTLVAKEGIKFHNDEDFNAEAIKLNLEAVVNSPLSGLANKNNFPEENAFEVIDERTLLVRTSFPYAAFEQFLAGAAALQAAPSQQRSEDKGTRNPVGTGPYQFEEWIDNDFVRVSAWDDYWGDNGEPFLDEIEFKVIVDPQARASALQAGDVDMIYTNSAAGIQEFRDSAQFQTVEDNKSEEVMVLLNQGKPPFDNLNARKALAYGTNQAAVVDILGEGVTAPVSSPHQEGSPWFVEDDGYPEYDVEEAEKYVQAYKDETGEDLSFTFTGLPNSEDLNLQQVLVTQWEAIGINVEIATIEQSAFIIELATAKFEAAYFRGFGYTDPASSVYFWKSDFAGGADQDASFSINFTQTKNDTLDQATVVLQESGDQAERKEASDTAVRTINEELPYIWLYSTPWAIIYRNGIGGLNPARELGVGNIEPKPWVGGLFLEAGS